MNAKKFKFINSSLNRIDFKGFYDFLLFICVIFVFAEVFKHQNIVPISFLLIGCFAYGRKLGYQNKEAPADPSVDVMILSLLIWSSVLFFIIKLVIYIFSDSSISGAVGLVSG
jgi:hypothetical protein